MIRKRLKAMTALLKFLVLLASFHSGSYAHAFTSLSPVAGNLVRVNHLIRFDESMSNPKNKPSREPSCEPTNDSMVNDQITNQRLEWDKVWLIAKAGCRASEQDCYFDYSKFQHHLLYV